MCCIYLFIVICKFVYICIGRNVKGWEMSGGNEEEGNMLDPYICMCQNSILCSKIIHFVVGYIFWDYYNEYIL